MSDKLEEYRQKVVGINIDQRSLLSTDYFNTFNSVVMVMDVLPDAPELLEEVEQWRFNTYAEHFQVSGLDFADLAIEAYEHSPPELKEAFDKKVNGMRVFIEDSTHMLRRLYDSGELQVFTEVAHMLASIFRRMMEEGNVIVHGGSASTQSDIDKMF